MLDIQEDMILLYPKQSLTYTIYEIFINTCFSARKKFNFNKNLVNFKSSTLLSTYFFCKTQKFKFL